MRIGLFGGTFNPIHFGHLRSAEEIRESFQLGQVVFIPSAIPPHKASENIICPNHRAEMVKIATEGNSYFSVSEIEIERQGKSYSIETIDHFSTTYYPDVTLFFIMGIDAFSEIDTWKDYRSLFSRCNFVVTTRPGHVLSNPADMIPADIRNEFSYMSDESRFIHLSDFSVYMRDVTSMDISSTVIREKIKENRSIRYFLPDMVINYIEKHRLYTI
ncbi:MAG: nicotinate-nucleotide adenylyltransferase [Thermodesulfobacteriota bacterium]|nr:nicotinate-nucleotide adenylyltransferase [Thermodesulfobacteriota bacterium]